MIANGPTAGPARRAGATVRGHPWPPTQVAESRFAGHDKYRIATVCEGRAQSLAEIAAYTRMPLGVTRVLVADRVAEGLLTLHTAAPAQGFEERMNLLGRVLSGLREL